MTHGGKRPGAGRKHADPLIKRIPIQVRLPAWLVEWLREHGRIGRLIEEAVTERHRLNKPEA